MHRVITGLERLISNQAQELQQLIVGNVALLTHSAAVTCDYEWGIAPLKRLLGKRLTKLYGPQHGLVTNVQDNMIESSDFFHPYWQLPVYSLYSHIRSPSKEMLEAIDTIIVDLQDIGGRVYTYIYTMGLLMESVRDHLRESGKSIRIVVLDRPNPIGGELVEGRVLEEKFSSFVGRYPIACRHGMTIGEVAKFVHLFTLGEAAIDLQILPMLNWKRDMVFSECGLPWVIPSPNISSMESTLTFVGTVLFEGTNLSEGRGTVRALELVGHPKLDGFNFCERMKKICKERELTGMALRPLSFIPTFQKHQGVACGGVQIHPTDKKSFRSWHLGQTLLAELYKELGTHFAWKQPPYEYEHQHLPIDIINGSDQLRLWVERGGDYQELLRLEAETLPAFLAKRARCLLY
ncbi:MAG: DUF1343 domain-containing protein [Oligoflexia bacterium]|nr:DUF1343 domain-containing protein [Oligoflexia bacterium]MBF0366887.1 DUF1343 domain-containing protein [Oligoflexia bacterium]